MANQKFLTKKIIVRQLIMAVVLAVIGVAGILVPIDCSAGWLIYHKPEYKGKVIDAGTGEPIEGAVVVVVYREYTFLKFDGHTHVIGAQETLTDKNGEFIIPSFTKAMNPFASEDEVDGFIIYKPGYKSEETSNYHNCFIEVCVDNQNKNDRIILQSRQNTGESPRAFPTIPDVHPDEIPIFYKMLNDERLSLGLRRVGVIQ